MLEKQEWIAKIKDWVAADTDDGETDMVTLELSDSGLTYHEAWRACEQAGFKQEDLEIGKDDHVESITFEKRKGELFQLVLEYKASDEALWLAKYYA